MGVRGELRAALVLTLAICAASLASCPALAQQKQTSQEQTPAPPQKTLLVLPEAPLLPQHFGSWSLRGPIEDTSASQLSGPDAASLKDYQFQKSASADYVDPRGGDSIRVTVSEFDDATGAAGAYTLFTQPGMRSLRPGEKLGSAAALGDHQVLFWTGKTVVQATSAGGHQAAVSELNELAASMPKVSGPKGAPPLLPTLLPAKGLQAGSIRYSLGPSSYRQTGGLLPADILGWDKSAEAVTSSYDLHGGKGILTLLLYPTPQIAGDRGRALQDALNAMPPDQRHSFGTIMLRREGPMLLVTTGAISASDAHSLIEGIHLPLQLSWDKPMPPQFHTEILKTYSLLTSIAVLSGVLMAAAVFLGLFLGGGRALVRVLQGKPAAVEPEFLHLDLRGQSAPLRSELGPNSGS